MALFKCKMCGGDLEVTPGTTVAECEYCGTKQTLPKVNEEVIQNLFNRANALRLKCEFDKAEQIYEKILQENDAESEAHWGIVLCKYGIDYVEDPKTYKRIPTCHRTSYDAVTADADYLAAVEHADAVQRSIYEAEAKAIDDIQKNILSIVKDEKPFDVFICYKETDENGKRTIDSTIANDIYYQLTQEGLKVFYAAITLEDKLGREYEPYIFAALNSAKVMLVIGTKPQYFSAVWVKNEWSRFLKLMKTDRDKLLIPCYRDMDAYELPEEFAHLQAQDMSKIGFINDVVRGIKKVAVKDESKATVVKETVVTGGNANTEPLLKRAFMFLEDGDWNSANEYCEKVLDIDPENASAYLGKLMAELHVRKQESLKDLAEPFDRSNNYQKAVRFGNQKMKLHLAGYAEQVNEREKESQKHKQARVERIKKRNKKIALVAIPAILAILSIMLGNVISFISSKNAVQKLKDIQVGDYITFGQYEQDNNQWNGPEDIEWLVLSVEDEKALVISKFGLYCGTYYGVPHWGASYDREELNGDFYNSSFSTLEKKIICSVQISTDEEYTEDKVFLLSEFEINQYFSSKGARSCLATEYAINHGVKYILSTTNSPICSYALRDANYVVAGGYVRYIIEGGSHVDIYPAIRPAMWIDLSKIS